MRSEQRSFSEFGKNFGGFEVHSVISEKFQRPPRFAHGII